MGSVQFYHNLFELGNRLALEQTADRHKKYVDQGRSVYRPAQFTQYSDTAQRRTEQSYLRSLSAAGIETKRPNPILKRSLLYAGATVLDVSAIPPNLLPRSYLSFESGVDHSIYFAIFFACRENNLLPQDLLKPKNKSILTEASNHAQRMVTLLLRGTQYNPSQEEYDAMQIQVKEAISQLNSSLPHMDEILKSDPPGIEVEQIYYES